MEAAVDRRKQETAGAQAERGGADGEAEYRMSGGLAERRTTWIL